MKIVYCSQRICENGHDERVPLGTHHACIHSLLLGKMINLPDTTKGQALFAWGVSET